MIVACGTSYHAGLIGRYAIETWSRVPVEMDVASEFRYRDPVIDERDLVIGISQSGETADTLAAMRLAREKGAGCWPSPTSWAARPRATPTASCSPAPGLEIGVAATKTFVAQVAAMYLFALKLAEVRGTLEPEVFATLVAELKDMPHRIEELLASVDEPVQAHGRALARRRLLPLPGPQRRAWPWRSRARSSSRRSPTCPPTPTRPAR